MAVEPISLAGFQGFQERLDPGRELAHVVRAVVGFDVEHGDTFLVEGFRHAFLLHLVHLATGESLVHHAIHGEAFG